MATMQEENRVVFINNSFERWKSRVNFKETDWNLMNYVSDDEKLIILKILGKRCDRIWEFCRNSNYPADCIACPYSVATGYDCQGNYHFQVNAP
jgi:hypothetical protein